MASDTRNALLDTAEILFAERGIGNTTVRMITARAKANVAAVNFHFGSLESLQREVLLRRFRGIAESRTAALHDLTVGRRRPSAVEILRAWLAPMLAMSTSSDPGENAFARLLARTLVEPSQAYAAILKEELRPHATAFLEALCVALPELTSEEVANRIDFVVGALGHAFSDPSRREASLSKRRARDLARLTPQLLAFLEAGLVAPPALAAAAGAREKPARVRSKRPPRATR